MDSNYYLYIILISFRVIIIINGLNPHQKKFIKHKKNKDLKRKNIKYINLFLELY